MKKINKKTILAACFLILIFVVPVVVFGQTAEKAPIPIGNPLGDDLFDPRDIIGRLIAGLLSVVGSIALFVFILGGITWMTAAGNPDRVKRGRDMLVWGTLGLAVIFTSYLLVQFILGTISPDQGSSGTGQFGDTPGGQSGGAPGGQQGFGPGGQQGNTQ